MPKKATQKEVRWDGYVRLQTLCRAVGIDGPTQLALAMARQEGRNTPVDELSVSAQAGWWKGERTPTIDNLAAVIRLTGASADWLLMGKGDMFAIEPDAKAAAFDEIAATVQRIKSQGAADSRGRAVAAAQRRLARSRRQSAEDKKKDRPA